MVKDKRKRDVVVVLIIVGLAIMFLAQTEDRVEPMPEIFTFIDEDGNQVTRVYGVDSSFIPSRSTDIVVGSVGSDLSKNDKGLFGNLFGGLFAFIEVDGFLTGTAASSGEFVVVRNEFDDYGKVFMNRLGFDDNGNPSTAGSTCRVGEYVNAFEVSRSWFGLGNWQRKGNLFMHLYEVAYTGDVINFQGTYMKDVTRFYSWECLKQVKSEVKKDYFSPTYNYLCRDGLVTSSTFYSSGFTPFVYLNCASGQCAKQSHSSTFPAGSLQYPYNALLGDMCVALTSTVVDEGRWEVVSSPNSANAKWETQSVTKEKRTSCLPGYHIRGESELVTHRTGHLYCDSKPAECPPDYTEEKKPRPIFGGEVRWIQQFTHDAQCNRVLVDVEYLTVCEPGFYVTGYDEGRSSALGDLTCSRIVESSSTETRVEGCMDPNAVNHDPAATVHVEAMCGYGDDVLGCMDPEALNYDEDATVHDSGSCVYEGNGSDNTTPSVPGDVDDEDDEEFDYVFWGIIGIILLMVLLLAKDYSGGERR